MANKIDSNLTGLRYAAESAIGVLPATGVIWNPLEPNSYGDFGGTNTMLARAPINPSRQRQKGVVTDRESSSSFESDLTLDNMYDLLQGFFFALWRKKDTDAVSAVTGASYTVTTPQGSDWRAGDLVFGKGHAIAANNGLKLATASTATTVVAAGLAAEPAPPEGANIHRVGFQFAAGDAAIVLSNGNATLTSTAKDLRQLGLIPGEWVFLGGDMAAEQFEKTNNSGFCRVASVSQNVLAFDKTSKVFEADAGAGKTIRIFLGDVLKNESDPALIKQQSYAMERSLSTAGFEYVLGNVPNEFTLNLSTASKITCNLGFVALRSDTAPAGSPKAGARPSLKTDKVAFNTSSDFSRLRLEKVDQTGLASFLMEASIVINNGVTAMKGLGYLGGVDVSVGDFAVSATTTAYFNSIDAVQAVNDNVDTSIDFAIVHRNAGMQFDLPLLSLGNGRLTVEKDQAVKLPLSVEAGAHETLDHTMLINYFAYLPKAAEAPLV